MKDPLADLSDSPYEILECSPDVPRGEINRCYARVLPRIPGPKRPQTANARLELLAAEKRIQWDIFYYCVGHEEITVEPVGDGPPPLQYELPLPEIALGLEASELGHLRPVEVGDLAFREVSLSSLGHRYDQTPGLEPPQVVFDR
jgi:hypothetical protein